jgi:predicted amidophosphoribosyltransferase
MTAAKRERSQAPYHRQRHRALRQRRRCLICQTGRTHGSHAVCAGCRESWRGRYEERKAQGLCVYCGQHAAGDGVGCPPCVERRNEQRRARRAR